MTPSARPGPPVSLNSHDDETPLNAPSRATLAGSVSQAIRASGNMGRADDLFRQGRHDQALVMYKEMVVGTESHIPNALHYRMALCLEGLGRWDQAIAEFGALASSPADASATSAAQLGQARVWLRMKKTDEAKRTLCNLIMTSPPMGLRQKQLLAESSYLLGLALAAELIGPTAPGPTHDSAVVLTFPDWRAEDQLHWIEATSADESSEDVVRDQTVHMVRHGSVPESWEITLSSQRCVVAEILNQLAQACELQPVWSDQAQDYASGRTIDISSGQMPLPVALTALTAPLAMLWEIRDGAIQFCRLQDISEQEQIALRGRIARLMLLATASNADNGPNSNSASAYLALGSLAFSAEDTPDSIMWYARLLSEFPRSPLSAYAHFNLGVVHRSVGNIDAGRAAMYNFVDGSLGHVLTPLAYLIIGRMHLDEGDPDGAITPLRRAVSLAAGKDTQPHAAIALATALLLSESPRVASSVLLEHRDSLAQPPFRNATAFLGTYARFRSISDRKKAQHEAHVLVWSLMGASSDSVLPPSGVILIGRAYRDLGLNEQMAATYEKALAQGVADRLAEEIRYDLAEFSLSAGRREAGIEQLTRLAEAEGERWSQRAGLRLAEIALDERRPDDCLNWCRKLLEHPATANSPTILSLMGRAYELAGDHHKAAVCFSGHSPAK